MISLNCFSCQSQYELPDEDAGSVVQCACGQLLTVPQPEHAASGGVISIACGDCQAQYEVSAEDAGTQAQCVCGTLIDIPAAASTPIGANNGDAGVATAAQNFVPNSIAVLCPACNSGYELGLEDAGTQVRCPCGEVLAVPSTDELSTSNFGQESAFTVDSIPIVCPACSSAYELGAEDAGAQVQCACGQTMTVPTLDELAANTALAQSNQSIADTTDTAQSATDDSHSAANQSKSRSRSAKKKTRVDTESPESESGKRESGSKRKKKKTSLLIPAAIGCTVIAALVVAVVVNNGKQKSPSQTGQSAGDESPADSAAGPSFEGAGAWQSWVSKDTVAIVVIEPAKIADSAILASLPRDTILAAIRDNVGFELDQLDRIYGLTSAEGASTWIIVGSEKLNKRHIHGTLLPGSEPITDKALTWYKGQSMAMCFPTDTTTVVSDVATFPARLASIKARKLAPSALREVVEASKVIGEILVYVSPTVLTPEIAAGELDKSVLDDVASIQLVVNLNASQLVAIQVDSKTEASAKKLLTKFEELKGTAQSQFQSLIDSPLGQVPDEAAPLKAIAEQLVNSLTVFRNENSVTMSLTAPVGLPQALKVASPLLAGEQLQQLLAFNSNANNTSDDNPAGVTNSAAVTKSTSGEPRKQAPLNWPIAPKQKFRSYEKAYDAFVKFYGKIDELAKEIPDAEDAKKPALRKTLLLKRREAAGVLRELEKLSIRLQAANGDTEKLLQSRYLLAYFYSQLKLNYEAAILAQWVLEHDDPKNKRALECGFLSLLAWQSAYQAAGENDRVAERKGFVNVATQLDAGWPDDPKVDGIRYTMGQILQIADLHLESADWYAKVRPAGKKFADAQLAAGQGYWRSYLALSKEARKIERDFPAVPSESIDISDEPTTVEHPAPDKPADPSEPDPATDEQKNPDPTDPAEPAPANADPETADTATADPQKSDQAGSSDADSTLPDPAPNREADQQLETVPDTSQPRKRLDFLRTEMNRVLALSKTHLTKGIELFNQAKEEAASDTLIAAKVTLAQLHQRSSENEQALAILQAEPKSVLAAISVEDEATRPETGIKSRRFASAVWQIILRAQVSLRQLEKAREAMESLETVAGGKDSSKLTAIYLNLGKELVTELETASPEAAVELRSAFVEFLTAVSAREQQSYGSLLWVGETCTALAESSEIAADRLAMHTQATAAWQGIIQRASDDRSFCSPQTVAAIRIRYAKSLRGAGQFEQSVKTFAGILGLQPNSFDMQFQVARTLQKWGETTDAKEHILESVNGLGDSIWGWGKTSIRLQRLMASGNSKPEYRAKLLEARYQIALCRRAIAATQTGAKSKTTLEKALNEMRTTARLSASLDGPWWDKLDEQYQAIQADLNLPVKTIRQVAEE